MRRAIVVISAVTFALAGPRLFSDASKARSAGQPFAYLPPEGFVPEKEKTKDGVLVYVHPDTQVGEPAVVAVHHSAKTITFAEGELARLVADMPKAFEDAKCPWVHRRTDVVTRADGARVGVIEGDCDREVQMRHFSGQMTTRKFRTRKLQIIFPDDTGLSIATASYATEEAARWLPAFEATVHSARGVASRYPPPSPLTYAMWAAAGAILGWLGAALVSRRTRKEA